MKVYQLTGAPILGGVPEGEWFDCANEFDGRADRDIRRCIYDVSGWTGEDILLEGPVLVFSQRLVETLSLAGVTGFKIEPCKTFYNASTDKPSPVFERVRLTRNVEAADEHSGMLGVKEDMDYFFEHHESRPRSLMAEDVPREDIFWISRAYVGFSERVMAVFQEMQVKGCKFRECKVLD